MYRTAPKTFISLDEKTAGAALRYHLKQALERSHSISDFTQNLELSAKKSKFSNKTMQIIEELNQGLKSASEEVSAKTKELEDAFTPLKEFGTNYAEFALKPKEALNKLLEERSGQVAGAMYRDDLGGIDFVWGNENLGIEHILKRRIEQYQRKGLTSEQAELRATNLIKLIPEVLEKGIKVDKKDKSKINYEYKGLLVALRDTWQGEKLKNKWVITSFEDRVPNLREQAKSMHPSEIIKEGENLSSLNSKIEPNSTTNLSPLELANLEKQQKHLKEPQNAPKNAKEKEKSYNESFETKEKDEKMPKLSFNEIKELIDKSPNKGREMLVLGEQNLTPEVVEYIEKNNKKIAIEKIEPSLAKELGLEYPNDAKIMIDFSAIKHILNRHGKNSNNVIKSKQPPITYDDIANYRNIVENADETLRIRENDRVKLLSYKQINGYFVVVEQVSKKQNGLSLVTMFKENGDYRNSKSYLESIDANNLHSRL